ncbi:MAG: DUF3619 family protein [Burkholderiales bacterium]|jgi:hypothetical protein|nr:DUF3619 family protein [Burkholderiales bacterium]
MNQDEFGLRVRQALNDGAERLDYRTVLRLEQARSRALAGQRRAGPVTVRLPALQLASTAGGTLAAGGGRWGWLRGAGLVAPLLALAVGFVAISQWQEESEIRRLAAIDLAVLLDEGPLDAYADRGFGELLQAEGWAER